MTPLPEITREIYIVSRALHCPTAEHCEVCQATHGLTVRVLDGELSRTPVTLCCTLCPECGADVDHGPYLPVHRARFAALVALHAHHSVP